MAKVHVAFGFHVNLYHSFREDTNDQKGFASDIRVIRHIIDVLDTFNQKGIAVKGTWDFENVFSLEKTLPEYAPDIIDNVRRRVKENGDEAILMGYNNGAMGAMTKEELFASVSWAISNEKRSGIKDVFGSYEPLLRPQEMMFTPSQVKTYKDLGVEALCMYYSAIPFDGFRTLIPLLPEKYAFNPLNYRYKDDVITMIPTYNTGDLIDFGSLRQQVQKLHTLQKSGEIDTDVLIFINMDADSEHWYGLDYPYPLNKLPNMTGLNGMIEELKNLPYVVFDTPGNYLKNHPPLKEITFSQDLADGSFDGYSSWSEKPFNRQIWTRLERVRALPVKSGMEDEAFKKRVRLLSTTHFGLSTPHMNLNREKKALDLSKEMLSYIDEHTKIPTTNWQGGQKGEIRFCLPSQQENDTIPPAPLSQEVEVLLPRIEYEGKSYHCLKEKGTPFIEELNGYKVSGTKYESALFLPNQVKEGSFQLYRYCVENLNGMFFSVKMNYPYTRENAYIFNEIAALQRAQDDGWQEVAPMEIVVENAENATIFKRNYEGDISSFGLSSFAQADSKNQNLDSFNHQVSNGIVGVKTQKGGFLVAVQKQVANSMAFCPMRLRDGKLYLNPFGTYSGKQRHHATHGNGLGALAAVYAAPQFYPLAPAYNGASEEVLVALFPFEDTPTESLWQQAIHFCEGNLPIAELRHDFCQSHPPQEASEEVKMKKLTSGIPLSLQAKILFNGVKSKIKTKGDK